MRMVVNSDNSDNLGNPGDCRAMVQMQSGSSAMAWLIVQSIELSSCALVWGRPGPDDSDYPAGAPDSFR